MIICVLFFSYFKYQAVFFYPEIFEGQVYRYGEGFQNVDIEGAFFYFDGKPESRVEILKILIKEFEADFSVMSYLQPRTSQLERVYIEMVSDDKEKTLNQYKEGML